jgi:iron complex outermembrane receptor protein
VSLTSRLALSLELRLNSITAYNDVKSKNLLDGDNSYLNLVRLEARYRTKTFSQEVTLTSSFGGMVDFAVGAFYYDSKACGCAISVYRPPNPNSVSSNVQHVDTKSLAEFGELTFTPTRRLQIIGGVRFTQEKKHSYGFATAPVVFTASDRDKSNNTSVRATARYTLNDNGTNVYATYSTGFKSSAYGTVSVIPQKARPEQIKAYEIGFKAPLFARRLLLTGAAFHYDYTDIQLSTLNLQTASVALQNAGKAKVEGAELGLTGRVGRHLSLNTGISWLPTAKYTSFVGAAITRPNPSGPGLVNVIADLSGTRLLRAPKFTFNLGGSFKTDVGNSSATLSANYYHSSHVYFLADERVGQPAYDTLDLRLSVAPNRGPLEVYAYGTNITKKYYATGAASSTGADSYYSGRPREIGIGAHVKY